MSVVRTSPSGVCTGKTTRCRPSQAYRMVVLCCNVLHCVATCCTVLHRVSNMFILGCAQKGRPQQRCSQKLHGAPCTAVLCCAACVACLARCAVPPHAALHCTALHCVVSCTALHVVTTSLIHCQLGRSTGGLADRPAPRPASAARTSRTACTSRAAAPSSHRRPRELNLVKA